MSTNQKKRRRRAGARPTGILAAPSAAAPKPRLVAPKRRYESRDTGLKHLLRSGKITRAQFDLGELYGLYYRSAELNETPPIKSCLDVLDRVGGGSACVMPPGLAWWEAQWAASARQQLELARSHLSDNLVMVCDLICGRHFLPWEIDPTQAVYGEYVVSLSNALEILLQRRWGRERIAA